MHSLPKPTFEGHKIGGWTSETRFYWAKKKALKAQRVVPLFGALAKGAEIMADTQSEKSLFDAARNLSDPARRRAFLDEACGGSQVLRTRIETSSAT